MAGWDQLLAARGIDVPNPIDLEKSRLTLGQMSNANALTGLNLDILRNTLAMQRDPAYPKYISALMSLASGGAPSGDASKIAEDLFTRFPMQGQNGVQQVMTLAKNAADIAKSRTEADKDAATAAEKRLTTLANTASAYATQKAPVTPAQAQRFVMNAQFFGHPEMVAGLPEAFTQGPEATKQWFADFAAAGSTPAQQATIAETTGRTALQNPQFQLERVRAATIGATALGAQIKTAGPAGEKTLPLEKFFVLPSVDYKRENILNPGEIVSEIYVPIPKPGSKGFYHKVRERLAWDHAIVAIASTAMPSR